MLPCLGAEWYDTVWVGELQQAARNEGWDLFSLGLVWRVQSRPTITDDGRCITDTPKKLRLIATRRGAHHKAALEFLYGQNDVGWKDVIEANRHSRDRRIHPLVTKALVTYILKG